MPTHTRTQALDALYDLTTEIADLHLQLAELYQADLRGKSESWFLSDAQYIAERDRIAEHNTLDLSTEIMRLNGELRAAEARREYFQLVVHWGPTV